MNKIDGLTMNKLEIQNGIDEILNMTINNDFRRGRKGFILRRKERRAIRSEKGLMEDRFEGGGTDMFDNMERAITFSF